MAESLRDDIAAIANSAMQQQAGQSIPSKVLQQLKASGFGMNVLPTGQATLQHPSFSDKILVNPLPQGGYGWQHTTSGDNSDFQNHVAAMLQQPQFQQQDAMKQAMQSGDPALKATASQQMMQAQQPDAAALQKILAAQQGISP